jgi:hypothetical protein
MRSLRKVDACRASFEKCNYLNKSVTCTEPVFSTCFGLALEHTRSFAQHVKKLLHDTPVMHIVNIAALTGSLKCPPYTPVHHRGVCLKTMLAVDLRRVHHSINQALISHGVIAQSTCSFN